MRFLLAALASCMILPAQMVSVRIQGRNIPMPREEYVAGVLAGEVNTFRSQEALKAMAVVARTYAQRFLGRHKAEGFDFCETTHCQDFRRNAGTPQVIKAAEETEGELLWYQGSPVAAFYHRHCGGRTEAASEVWPDMAAAYLRVQPDSYCISRGRGDWSGTISRDDLQRALGAAHPVSSVRILSRTPSGRVHRLRIDSEEVSAAALHNAVGRTLGWHLLRSSIYEVFPGAGGFVFQGYGNGHGVGLCQVGAESRSEARQTYRQILVFYYPGTAVGITASGFPWRQMGGERVDVFSTQEQEDRALPFVADKALREAERRAGLSYAGRPRVRVYPSVAAFRDATGEPGWVAASTAGSAVRLQPAGRTGATLLHEMLHVLVESSGHPSLPDWFREDIVVYLAAPNTSSRVSKLVLGHGRDSVMGWLVAGLPANITANIPNDSSQHQPGQHAQKQRQTETGRKAGALGR